jgi:putative hydrolase of the HAD superfamily
MAIEAVIFDYGNVISLPQAGNSLDHLATIAGLDRPTMEKIVWENRDPYDRGLLSGKEYYRTMLAAVGVELDNKAMEQLVRADLESWAQLNPQTVTLIEDLQQRGFRTGILSNMPKDFLALARERFPLFKKVEVGIFSCDVGYNKPERTIYEVLLKTLGLPADRTVFFDDIPVNVDGARALGIQAFLWKNPETAKKDLRHLGVGV